jgi:hypothetical protein
LPAPFLIITLEPSTTITPLSFPFKHIAASNKLELLELSKDDVLDDELLELLLLLALSADDELDVLWLLLLGAIDNDDVDDELDDVDDELSIEDVLLELTSSHAK